MNIKIMKGYLVGHNKKTLQEILQDYQRLENKLIENNGEINETLEQMLDINDSELDDKLDGYEKFVRYLKGQIEYLKNMENHYNGRRRVFENTIKSCRDSMVNALVVTGKEKVKTSDFNFHLGSSEKWSIDFDEISEEELKELVENNLAETSIKPKMNEIKVNYKGKDNIPKWISIIESKHIKVR